MTNSNIRLGLDDDEALAAALEVADATPSVTAEVESIPGGEAGALVEPVTVMLIGAGVLAAAQFILGWWERVRGGLVIDQREGAERTVYRDRDVPWGYVVVFPADGGKVTVETKDAPKDATERLIGQVVSGVLGSADAVKAAVKELLGEGKAKADPAPAG